MKTRWTAHARAGEVEHTGVRLLEADDPVAIGGRRLTGRLRSAGTEVAYLARDGAGDLVTVKTAGAEAGEHTRVRDRLRREAACARRLPAFCTPRLLHDGTDQTPPYLVNEYIKGPSLEQVVDANGPLSSDAVRSLAVELARALAAVHDAGIIHGNLTPANVVLGKDALHVVDFGIASEIRASGEPAEVGAVADNPGWLAPELLTGGPPGPACDVFGWGCLVGYAATGHSPRVDMGEPRRIEDEALDVATRAMLDAALADDPAVRPNAMQIATRLDAPVGDPLASTTALDLPTRTLDLPVRRDGSAGGHVPAGRAAVRHRGLPRSTRAHVVVSVLLALVVSLFVAAPTGTESHHHGAAKPARPRHRTAAVAEVSGQGAIHGPRHPRAARTGADDDATGVPPSLWWLRWRLRPPQGMRPDGYRRGDPGCSGPRAAWCPGSGLDADRRAPFRWPGWISMR